MAYPPLLYWSFAWLRVVSFRVAETLWETAIVVLMSASFVIVYCSTWRKRRLFSAFCFALLLGVQFPMMFAMERGNVDALIVFIWVFSAWAYSKSNLYLGWSGFALASTLKLFPGVGLIPFIFGQTLGRRGQTKEWILTQWKPAIAAMALVLLASFLDYENTKAYVFGVLPKYSRLRVEVAYYSHSLPAVFHSSPALKYLSWLSLYGSWAYLVHKKIRSDSFFVISGLLATTTFVAGVSYDYNLLTAYPLLFLLYLRASSKIDWALVLSGLLVFTGQAGLYLASRLVTSFPRELHVASLIGWLVILALYLAFGLGFNGDESTANGKIPKTD